MSSPFFARTSKYVKSKMVLCKRTKGKTGGNAGLSQGA